MMMMQRATSVLLSAASALAGDEQQQQECHVVQPDGKTCMIPKKPTCGVYMGPSTLGETVNMGIYTGQDLKEDDIVNFPEIAIPLLFRPWGEQGAYPTTDGQIWERYIWEGYLMDIESYTETNREDARAVFVPGIGCTINSILQAGNLKSTHGSLYDTAGLHRSKDPGSGAFCPYHSSKTIASRDIEAGAELFATYGDYWIPQLPGAQITFHEQMDTAQDFLLYDVLPFFDKFNEQDLSQDAKQALYDMIVDDDFPIYTQEFTVLPEKPLDEIKKVIQENNDNEDFAGVIRHFIAKQSIRTIDWLEEHAYCQDHIRPDTSTIDQAGRGAFASRHLPKGTVVGYSPLIHVAKEARDLYTIEIGGGDEKKVEKEADKQRQYDLIINYSFAHRNSTVMLTPYGGMVNYINHASDDLQPNVKIRWPDKELIAHKPEWLNKTVDELRDMIHKIGLSFEYVALRDIAEGEEVLMDYGAEWEQAWKEHVKNWKPISSSSQEQSQDRYQHSSEIRDAYFRTEFEQSMNPYPDHVITMCLNSYSTDTADGSYKWVNDTVETHTRHYCRVLDRTTVTKKQPEPLYTVELDLSQDEMIIVHSVPHDAIFLYDKAYSADWHLPNVFRYPIQIPDDVFPESWHNGPPDPPKKQHQAGKKYANEKKRVDELLSNINV